MKPKTVTRGQVTNIAMVAGGEKKLSRIIKEGELLEWVAIGWITLRTATDADRKKYPKLKEVND